MTLPSSSASSTTLTTSIVTGSKPTTAFKHVLETLVYNSTTRAVLTTPSTTTTEKVTSTTDVDDCASGPCKNQGTCVDQYHAFSCLCSAGWQGGTCNEDIDECSRGMAKCDSNATCTNTRGSYTCTCNEGYQGNGSTCQFVNSCLSNPCWNGATCVSSVNSFSCSCHAGYSGRICETDIDECSQGMAKCDSNATCTNTRGSYTCTCNEGYQGNGSTCQFVNSCLSNPCWNGATCVNSVNSFSCSCRAGYSGRVCEIDIDDCASNPCKNGAVCVDKINSFSCVCQKGWSGSNCTTDVDECSQGLSNCDQHAVCNNTLGSYTCTCNKGYTGDGFTCKEVRLFSFGPSVGDKTATKRARDFVSPLINVPVGFPFDSAFYYNLYFTDNGVIVFQRNSYDPTYILSYPYTAFVSNDPSTPPIIAAFWADSDFSGLGNLYYQVYNFQSSGGNMTFKNSLENAINGYFGSVQFQALWALKITWYKVPPFTALYNSEAYWRTQVSNTNTFQAILATDGIYSFVLILFDDGGMKWQFNSLTTSFHLPKMGYFSGIPNARNINNFPAFNDPQTEPSVGLKQRYSPDQYIGYNTGKKGQWAYRLDSNSQNTINSRLQCLDWYYKEELPFWVFSTSPCPCTYAQATWDSSFTDGYMIWYYGFDIKKTSEEQYLTVQSIFPSRSGSGSRCYYHSWSGALLYGEKERYLPTPWTSFNIFNYYYNPNAYISYFWNTVLPPQRQQYKEGEIDPFNACCKYSGSAYLCDLYRQKRPLDYCNNYVPPRIGFLFGDPHINTLDGVQYTFNGLGEFILANVKDDNGTIVFKLQGRTALAGDGTSNATNFVALAAATSHGDQIQWSLLDSNETIVSYNGTLIRLTENLTYADHLAFEKTASGEAKVLFDYGIAVSCTAKLGILSFVVTFPSTYQNRTSGLLGVFNGNPNDDFLTADGYTFPYSESAQLNDSQIFTFGMTWKTTPGDTIFLYNTSNGESWYTYNNNSFQPMFLDNLLSSSDPALLKDANSSCNGDKNCIFDILSTGSFAVGSATMNSNTVYTERRVLMESFPPNISGSAIIMGSLKEKVLMSYTAEESVFSLLATSTDVIISENGSLSWLPSSSATVFATIIANNSKAITQLAITFILCNCSNNATCDYLNAVQRGEWNSSKFMTASCNCSDGWTGEFCTEDFNACLGNTCFNTSSCIDEPPPSSGFKCSPCPPGLSGDLAGIKCFDIDECYTNISSCEQICINTLGGYTCSCNTGYAPDPANAHLCKDIDECLNTSSCIENAVCTNTLGSYSCHCGNGYYGDAHIFCTDINECALPSLNNCSNTFICINTNGSYYCECLPGYTGPNCSDVIQITTAQPTAKSNISQTTLTLVPPLSAGGTTLNVNPVTYSAHSPEQPSTLSLTASTSLKSTSHSVTEFVHTSMNSTYNTNATEMNAATTTATTTATSATSASSGAINSSVSTSTIVVGENTLRLFTATPTARHTVSSTSESTGTIRASSASPPATNSTTSHATTTYTASTAPRITESMPSNMTSTITNATSPATSSVRTTTPYLTSTISTPRTTNNIREAVNISVNATSNYNATSISATSSTTTMVNAVSADTASSASSTRTTTVNSTTTVSASTFNSSSTTKGTSTVNATTSRETTTSKTPTSAASATTSSTDVIQITTAQPTAKSNISQTTSTLVPPLSTGGTTLNVNPVTYSAHSPEQPSTLSLTASTSLKSTSHSVTEFVHTSMNSTYNTNATEMNAATTTATTTATSATSASSGAINSSVSTSTIVVGENTLRLFTATPTARHTVSSTSESTGTIRASSASPPATNSTTSHATTVYTASTAPRITESMPSNMTSTITNATTPATSSGRTTTPYLTSTISTTRTTNNIREAVNTSVNATSNYNATSISATSSTTTKVNAVSADTASSASSTRTTTVNSTTTVSASTFNSSSTTKGTSTVNATTSRETTTSKTPTSAASATTSSTGAPISNCSSTFCQVGSCFNGGTCTINTLTCSEQCKCPAPYEGSRCLSVANVFTPQPSKEIPKRIVGIKLWIKGENGSGLSDSSSVKYIGLQQAVNLTATGYLQAVMAFDKNTKILLNNVHGNALTTITSQFTYSNNATIITFLNENLMSTIISVFNSKTTSRRRRDTSAVTFGLMSPDNITDVQSVTANDLKSYFSCNSTGLSGYNLIYSSSGFTCVSPCAMGFCQNNATCEHKENGPICRCTTFSIYTSFGENCQYLAMNLGAFFGILFGAIAFVILVIILIILTVYCCRKRRRSESSDLTFSWGRKSITAFNRLQETNISGTPVLKTFTPNLENISVAPQFKIQRPSLERKSQSSTDP